MEYQDAAREVSALVDRIVADAEGHAKTLIEGSRREHDAAMQAIRSQLEAQASQLDARARELEDRAREKDRLAAVAREHEALAREKDARATEKDMQLAKLREDFEAQQVELEAQQAELEARQAEIEARQTELEAQRTELEAACRDAERQAALAAAHMSASQDLMEARSALERSQAEAQRLTRQFEGALDELRSEHVNTLQQQAVARTALPLDELLAMFNALSGASSPSAVLTTIVSGLGREFSRVALFRVRGTRLECVKHVGFEFEGDVAKVVIPTSLDCLMTRAVQSRRTQTFVNGSSQEPCAVPFGGTPACAVALPLISGDASIAVIYADDSDLLEFGSVPAELLVKFADLVWQHAVLVLQRMSSAQKMLAIAPAQGFERLA